MRELTLKEKAFYLSFELDVSIVRILRETPEEINRLYNEYCVNRV
jgi:hypothetical protein